MSNEVQLYFIFHKKSKIPKFENMKLKYSPLVLLLLNVKAVELNEMASIEKKNINQLSVQMLTNPNIDVINMI